MKSSHNKILLIAYSFPPLLEPQAIRWYNLSRELQALGYDVDLVSVSLPEFQKKKTKYEFLCNEYRTFPGPIEWLFSTLKKGNSSRQKYSGLSWKKKTYRFIRRSLNRVIMGDFRIEWLPFAIKEIRNISLKEYSVVITSQEPFVCTILGYWLKKQKKLKWIADLGDTASAPYYGWWRKLLEPLEGTILKRADAITVTGNSPAKWLKSVHPYLERKISIIQQGFSLKDCIKQREKSKRNSIFTIAFTGTFYKDFRNPLELSKALRALPFNFRFILAGRNEDFLSYFYPLQEKLIFKGLIPHKEALKLQSESDILIHFSNKQQHQIPGKFFEYLGSETPILTIYHDKKDETALLTEKLKCGIAVPNRENPIKEALEKFHSLWKVGKLEKSFQLNCEKFKEFSWEEGAKKLSHIIEALKS